MFFSFFQVTEIVELSLDCHVFVCIVLVLVSFHLLLFVAGSSTWLLDIIEPVARMHDHVVGLSLIRAQSDHVPGAEDGLSVSGAPGDAVESGATVTVHNLAPLCHGDIGNGHSSSDINFSNYIALEKGKVGTICKLLAFPVPKASISKTMFKRRGIYDCGGVAFCLKCTAFSKALSAVQFMQKPVMIG